MTVANTFAAKLTVAFVATAMAISAFAPAAQAQSVEELQEQVSSLTALIATLQAQLGGGGTGSAVTSSTVCPYTWTRSLSSGDTGADVLALQQFLNSDPDTRVAATGAGSVGMETDYYGPATGAAVAKFQAKYRADILSPLGLVTATTFFGPSTMAKANMLCTMPATTPDTDGDMDGDEDEDEDEESDVELQGEASLDKAEIDGASDDEIQEGQADAPLAELDVEFTDGDAEISRIDVRLVGSGDETDPWDTFETLSLWVDGDKIAEENADDEDDYLDEDDGSMRFSGLDLVVLEDEETTIVLAGTVQNSVDIGSDSDAWVVSFDAVRYFDAEDVATTDNSTGDLGDPGTTESFTINEEGGDDELIVKTSSNDPDATTLALEDDSDSDWETVFIFDLDTDDSDNDIELNNVYVTVELSSSTYNAIVDDAELVIDGTTIDDVSVTGGGTATAVLNFDVDGDVVIDAGEEVEAELMLQFNALDLGNEGMTVRGRVTTANANSIDAEGADDLTNTGTDQLRGSATGDYHTLRTSGLDVSDFTSSVDVTTNDTADDSYGEFTIEFDVTAIGDDEIYIPLTDSVFDNTGSTTFGVVYHVENSSGTNVASSSADQLSAVLSLESGGEETDNGNVRLDSGDTATLELVITFNPGSTADQYKAVLRGIGFMLDDAADNGADFFEATTPESDYDTTSKNITS